MQFMYDFQLILMAVTTMEAVIVTVEDNKTIHAAVKKVCYNTYEPRSEKTGLRGLRPGPTNRTVQPHKMARGLKFQI